MSLRTVEYVVFDEADRLFEMGFADQVGDHKGWVMGNAWCLCYTLVFALSVCKHTPLNSLAG